MISKQNRALGFLFIFAFIVVGLILFRRGQFIEWMNSARPSAEAPVGPESDKTSQESMGDPVSGAAQPRPLADTVSSDASATDPLQAEKKNFAEVMKALAACLQMKTPIPALVGTDSESFLATLQAEWGVPNMTDHWMNWHFRNREGVERRLRLEVNEGTNGETGRDLHYFAVDREGLPIPVTLENVQTHNPSDAVIDGILKEGEVFFKEKSASGTFDSGESVDYIEKNGAIDSFEVHHIDKSFHCTSAPSNKTCVCR